MKFTYSQIQSPLSPEDSSSCKVSGSHFVKLQPFCQVVTVLSMSSVAMSCLLSLNGS